MKNKHRELLLKIKICLGFMQDILDADEYTEGMNRKEMEQFTVAIGNLLTDEPVGKKTN